MPYVITQTNIFLLKALFDVLILTYFAAYEKDNVEKCNILYFMTSNIIMKHIEDHLNYDIADFLLIEKIKKG